MSPKTPLLIAAGCLLAAGPVGAVPIEQITNGDFETGDFTGWTNVGLGAGSGFVINDGSFDPSGPGLPTPPIGGSYDAVSDQFLPSTNLVSQSFVVPTNITLATVSWDDRIQNYGEVFSDPNQEFRVVIQDVLGTTLVEVFSTDPGDPSSQPGPNHRVFDLTADLQRLAGIEIQLAFVEQDNLGNFNATVDNVSLMTEVVPEPGAAALFGIGALLVASRTREGRAWRPRARGPGCRGEVLTLPYAGRPGGSGG